MFLFVNIINFLTVAIYRFENKAIQSYSWNRNLITLIYTLAFWLFNISLIIFSLSTCICQTPPGSFFLKAAGNCFFSHVVYLYKNDGRIFPIIQFPLHSHVQLLSTKVAGEVILRQNNQHLTAAVHTVGHVLDDGSSNFKVPAVDAVVNRVPFKNWDEILSDPASLLNCSW